MTKHRVVWVHDVRRTFDNQEAPLAAIGLCHGLDEAQRVARDLRKSFGRDVMVRQVNVSPAGAGFQGWAWAVITTPALETD